MMTRIKNYYEEKPLQFVLIVGFLARLISIFFSKGYGMHDDHYLVIEAAQSWVDGFDYNNWLPENSVNGGPTGHSFFYVGLHFIFFYLCDAVGFTDPQNKMFIVRLLHGAFSLITVYAGYKITEVMSNRANAKIVGMLLALYWFFPILSVRNLVEVTCLPFIMLSFWVLVRRVPNLKDIILAGALMGLALGIRLQTYLIFGGVGLVLLFDKKLISAIAFGLSAIGVLFLTQITDLFLWGKPFAEFLAYVEYNSTYYNEYISQAWYQYFLVILGILLPPVSIFLLFGYFYRWKKYLLLFLPTFIFLAFHSVYPNKQERFILPIIPLLIIAGVMGWSEFRLKSKFWLLRPGLYKGFMIFFWGLNILALLFVSPASSKKSIVDSMYFLWGNEDVTGIVVERTLDDKCYLFPRFYSGKWDGVQYCYSQSEEAKNQEIGVKALLTTLETNYCFFVEENQLESRLEKMKAAFPDMEYVTVIEPSYIDKLLAWMNPRNRNEVIYIYKLY